MFIEFIFRIFPPNWLLSTSLIALMLGRLRMSILDCIEAYKRLSTRVFKPKRGRMNVIGRSKDLWSLSGSFDADELSRAIQDIVEQSGESGDAKLLNTDSRCRVFVCALRDEVRKPVRLRSYRTPLTVDEVDCTIVEAARTTSAASSFFKKVVIDDQTFVDGALGFNNPVDEVLDEVEQIWSPSEFRIERFLSVGMGRPPIHALGGNMKEVAAPIIKISTETEQTAQRFEQRALRTHGLSGQYFRFNAGGLENLALEDYKSFGLIVAATNSYLNEPDTFQKLNRFVAAGSPFPVSSERYAYLQSLRWYDVGGEPLNIASPIGSTFRWVLQNNIYKSWFPTPTDPTSMDQTPTHPVLHIRGKPGSGKSVLLAFLHTTISTMNTTVAYFACSQSNNNRRTPEMILSCLLRQILERQPNLFRVVVPRYAGSEPWAYRQLLKSFKGVLTSPDNTGIICMIGAIDECHEASRRQFIKDLALVSEAIHHKSSARQLLENHRCVSKL
ncbi:acyl transferase/acyl hydrolase/lysophospholipase [Xylaria longipes]|nr:acyl transferase/acyl hydrolase/lysophospholipase [Xylaria longipes]